MMETIHSEEVIDNKTYTLTHYFDTTKCYDIVKEASEHYWTTTPNRNGYDNYRFDTDAESWALGPLLANNKFAGGFTVLSIDNKPWAFAGIKNIPRKNRYTALILARNFCFFTVKPVTHGLILPLQLKIAKDLGYTKAWFTLNKYNYHLYQTWHVNQYKKKKRETNKIYTDSNRCVETSEYLGLRIVNDVQQHIIEWKL
jgi:hypothetical protein